MSPAVISPGPVATSGTSTSSASVCIRTTMLLEVEDDVGDVLLDPGMLENSWATPSIRTLVIAAPFSEESSTRRRLLPYV